MTSLSLFGHIVWLDDNADAKKNSHLEETAKMPSDDMDEDSPKWPWVPQSHIDWSS